MNNKRIKKLIRGKACPGKPKVVLLDSCRKWYPSVYVCIDCAYRENIYLPENIDYPTKWIECHNCNSKKIFLISGKDTYILDKLELEISPKLWNKP